MQFANSGPRGSELQQALHQKLLQAFQDGRAAAYRLASSERRTPCILAEWQEVNGELEFVTLIHGRWARGPEQVRVTTWRELEGQSNQPDEIAEMEEAAPAEDVSVLVDGQSVAGTLHRGADPGSWQVRTAVGDSRILVVGTGEVGELALETVEDIAPALEARRALLDRLGRP
jgi:hypothetical protein